MVAYALCQSEACPRKAICGRHEGCGEPLSPNQEYLVKGPRLTEDANCIYFFDRPAKPAVAQHVYDAPGVTVEAPPTAPPPIVTGYEAKFGAMDRPTSTTAPAA